MPHVAFVPFVGARVREPEMRALGMSLPGLRRRVEAVGALPALGLLTLAGLTPTDWSRSWHEAGPGQPDPLEAVLAEQPTLIAISALTASIEEAYAFATAARARGARTVLGGLHATTCQAEAGAHVDAVVVGEGEPVWARVLQDAAAGALAPRYQARAPWDLAQAPLPPWELLGSVGRPRYTLQTARGCPLACEFCGASRLLGSYRVKPASTVAAELKAITSRDPRPVIELADDSTFAGDRPAGPLLEALAESGARWFTEADWRIGERPDVLAGLAAAGCVQVLIGVESLVRRHRGMGPKSVDPQRIVDAAAAVQDHGVPVNACYIVGADGETRATLDGLAGHLDEAPFADLQLTLQTPFPGTALRRRLQREGRLLPDRGWSHHTLFDVTYVPDRLSPAELEAGFREVVEHVFRPAAQARRDGIRRRILASRREAS